LLSVILTRSTGANAAKYARQGLFKTIIMEWTAEFGDGRVALSYVDGDGRAFKVRGVPKE
jgi:hypothetical protein